jgi:hypothetical protein
MFRSTLKRTIVSRTGQKKKQGFLLGKDWFKASKKKEEGFEFGVNNQAAPGKLFYS